MKITNAGIDLAKNVFQGKHPAVPSMNTPNVSPYSDFLWRLG